MDQRQAEATQGVEALVAEAVRRLAVGLAPQAVVVFGSMARGTARPDSDLDLLVVTDTLSAEGSDWTATYLRAMDLLWGIRLPIDVLLCTPAEFAKWRDTRNHVLGQVAREGKVAYGRI